MTIGDRIAKYRRNQGLSQEELAEKLGISRQSVSKWERNESLPEADKIPLLAQVFSITTDELLTGEEPQAQQAPPPAPVPVPAPGGRGMGLLAVPAVGLGRRAHFGGIWGRDDGHRVYRKGCLSVHAASDGNFYRWGRLWPAGVPDYKPCHRDRRGGGIGRAGCRPGALAQAESVIRPLGRGGA